MKGDGKWWRMPAEEAAKIDAARTLRATRQAGLRIQSQMRRLEDALAVGDWERATRILGVIGSAATAAASPVKLGAPVPESSV